MGMGTIESILGEYGYPGSGILAGSLGGRSVLACFVTAREEQARNRLFQEQNDSLSIRVYGADAAREQEAILYYPVRVCAGGIVAANGDHAETVCASLDAGHSFQYAMSARCYNPDAPAFTPRIACLVLPTGRYTLGIVKKADDSADCRRKYWSYDPADGTAHMIVAYDGGGEPPRPFSGEPRVCEISGSSAELTERIWRALDAENRVSLYVRVTDLFSGRFESSVKNASLQADALMRPDQAFF